MTHPANHDVRNAVIPIVIEKTGQGERAWDIYSRLLKERIIFIGDEVSDASANVVIAQLLYLQFENKSQDISIYVNSPGGSVTAGLAIYDTMQFVGCDVATYCLGQASSMGAVLLAAGTKGKRYALPHAETLVACVRQRSTVDVRARTLGPGLRQKLLRRSMIPTTPPLNAGRIAMAEGALRPLGSREVNPRRLSTIWLSPFSPCLATFATSRAAASGRQATSSGRRGSFGSAWCSTNAAARRCLANALKKQCNNTSPTSPAATPTDTPA